MKSIVILSCISLASLLVGCAGQTQKPTAAPARPTAQTLPRDPVVDTYVGAMRAELSDGKVQLINHVMNLSGDEAKIFWPIYQDYESESFDLGDQRVDLIRRFAAAQGAGKMDDAQASSIAEGYFRFESDRLALLKEYHGIISKELSSTRAAQFTQVENRVGTIVDLMIASEVPLVQEEPGSAQSAAKN